MQNPAQVVCLVAGKLAVSPFAFFSLSKNQQQHVRSICTYIQWRWEKWRECSALVQIIQIDRLSRLLV
jgi:hypothetical protein